MTKKSFLLQLIPNGEQILRDTVQVVILCRKKHLFNRLAALALCFAFPVF